MIHSPSSIKQFENCAYQYQQVRILKTAPEVEPSEAIVNGLAIHKHFEDAILKQVPLPDELKRYEQAITFIGKDGNGTAELEVAVTRVWKPTGFLSDNAYIRGKVDFFKLTRLGKHAVIGDWKTGKRWLDRSQLQIYATILLSSLPKLISISCVYVWTKTQKHDLFLIKRSQVRGLKQLIDNRIQVIETSIEREHFPKRTGPLCSFCPVLETCPEGTKYVEDRKK